MSLRKAGACRIESAGPGQSRLSWPLRASDLRAIGRCCSPSSPAFLPNDVRTVAPSLPPPLFRKTCCRGRRRRERAASCCRPWRRPKPRAGGSAATPKHRLTRLARRTRSEPGLARLPGRCPPAAQPAARFRPLLGDGSGDRVERRFRDVARATNRGRDAEVQAQALEILAGRAGTAGTAGADRQLSRSAQRVAGRLAIELRARFEKEERSTLASARRDFERAAARLSEQLSTMQVTIALDGAAAPQTSSARPWPRPLSAS